MTKKKNIYISHSLSTLSVFILILIWQLYSIKINNSIIMPQPFDVLETLWELLISLKTYSIILATFKRLFITIGISTLLGLSLGLISGMHYQLEAFLKPIVVSLRTLPVISIIVIVLILYGNVFSLYIITFLLLFPIIYQAELDGVKHIDPLLISVLKLECNRCSPRGIRMVYLPLSLPFLRTGIIQSAGLGIKILVVAEYISQAKVSIGREIYLGRINLEYNLVFAWSIILIIVVLLVEHLVEKYLITTYKN
ncbi:hypothetical protein CI105_03615 [Candidatus Izimaplasma bacterium ZiA1]|nr:hypothetical protein CI105_03615 [Candidatus Izimaplasma bacterium ZiA1]